MYEVKMPRLSDSMEEGTIVQWLVGDGDAVKRGQEIVEIETDKATMAYEADAEGAIHIVVAAGTTVKLGEVIAHIGDRSELPEPTSGATEQPATAEVASGGEAASRATTVATRDEPAAGAVAAAAHGDGNGSFSASPLARRYAAAAGIELGAVSGSGPYGRIIKADVVAAEQRGRATIGSAVAAEPATPAAAADDVAQTAKGRPEVQELTRLQHVVARRMAEAKATIPEFALQAEVDMEAAIELREQMKASAPEGSVVPSFNDIVIKACAVALTRHPRANGSYRDGRFELYERVNIGVAVAAQDALLVPVVPDAHAKSLGQIAVDVRRLADRVRDGSITPPELAGGTFTVSNLGMYGVSSFQAVINPPQAAILAVGEVSARAVVRDGSVVPRRQMSITLGCDHRILYGADAAEFLAEIRRVLESPTLLAF